MSDSYKLEGLYVITDDALTPPDSIFAQVTEALEGGANIVQLRDKTSSLEKVKETAELLQQLCNSYDALFVLNDKVELAIELGISGLHIGKSDHHRAKEIRSSFKGVLGVSCYADVEHALEMQKLGMDYVAFGSFYSSPTKRSSNIIPLHVLKEAKEKLNIPVCAIGGINAQNIDEVLAFQPDMVSLVSDIWQADDIQAQCKIYSKIKG